MVADLRAGAGRVGAVGVGPAWQGQARQPGDVGHVHMGPGGERMSGWQDHNLALRAEFFGVESGRRVERLVQQRDVGPALAQESFLLGRPAQDDVDGDRAGFGGVRDEQFRQQFAGRAGFRDQDQAGTAGRGKGGAAGPALGGGDRVEGRPALDQQHRAGLGQRDGAAGPVQQYCPEPAFELLDRP